MHCSASVRPLAHSSPLPFRGSALFCRADSPLASLAFAFAFASARIVILLALKLFCSYDGSFPSNYKIAFDSIRFEFESSVSNTTVEGWNKRVIRVKKMETLKSGKKRIAQRSAKHRRWLSSAAAKKAKSRRCWLAHPPPQHHSGPIETQ
jgi:hypothetical protein